MKGCFKVKATCTVDYSKTVSKNEKDINSKLLLVCRNCRDSYCGLIILLSQLRTGCFFKRKWTLMFTLLSQKINVSLRKLQNILDLF